MKKSSILLKKGGKGWFTQFITKYGEKLGDENVYEGKKGIMNDVGIKL